MKPISKLFIYLILLLSILFVVYQVSMPWNPIALQKNTSAFLDKVKQKKYDDASALYGHGAMIEKNIWALEMKKLHEETKFRLLSYDNVKADYDDGAFNTGHADLTFEIAGKPLIVSAILTFGPGGKPRQICAIHPPQTKPGSIQELVKWNRLVCGGSF